MRFLNRVASKKKGWLPPSLRQKVQSHLTVIDKLHEILPVSKIMVETARFNIQKIKNPDIEGEEYQKGEQLGFYNVREYVLYRDHHTCQHCKGKSKDPVLNVHHIESRQTGGNAPNNLITLCGTCHKKHHQGEIDLSKSIKRGQAFKDATFMNVLRQTLLDQLSEKYPDVSETYGYITKATREKHNFPKAHYIDARCISGNPLATPLGYYFHQKKVRCHNRQIHKMTIGKGGKRKRHQAEYEVHGFRLFDKVRYKDKEYFVFARRKSGYFDIRTLNGEKANNGNVSYKKLKLLEHRKSYIIERRTVAPPTTREVGFRNQKSL
jgi:hypothetical protein